MVMMYVQKCKWLSKVHSEVQQDHNIKLVLSTMASYLTKVESRFLGCDSYLAPEKEIIMISYFKLFNCKISRYWFKRKYLSPRKKLRTLQKTLPKQSFYSGPLALASSKAIQTLDSNLFKLGCLSLAAFNKH